MSPTISLPELVAHGQHVQPALEGASTAPNPDAQASSPQATAVVHGTLARFDKRHGTSATPQAFGWIKATYADAIEYAGQKQALEGGIMMVAFMGVPFALAGIGMMLFALSISMTWVLSLGMLLGIFGMTLFAYWITLFPLRHVWRTPRDLPIIFDRANRRIYRMAQQVQPGLKGLIKPWPVKALCYEWELVDAEHHSELVGSANMARRLHRLVFVVRKSAEDPTVIDSFEVGNGLAQTEEMVAPMYEHIHRFMEQRGPHLPHRDEPLDERSPDLPSWWQACGRAGPWGNRYLHWWKEEKFMSVLHHVLVGITLGFYWLVLGRTGKLLWWQVVTSFGFAWISLSMVWGQGTGMWLMAHTAYQLDWPAAVHQAIGAPQRKGRGW